MIGELGALFVGMLLVSEGTDTGGKGMQGQWPELTREAQRAQVSPDWIRFLKAWAYHESKGNPRSINRSPSEAKAAGDQYDNNRQTMSQCAWGRGGYSWGSGGWFGLLPVSAVWAFKGTPGFCRVNPRKTMFNPWESVLEAIDYARRSMRRDSFKANPTWQTLNRATAAPTLMDEYPGSSRYPRAKKSDDNFAKALAKLNLPASFAQRRVTPLPDGWNAYNLYRGAVA